MPTTTDAAALAARIAILVGCVLLAALLLGLIQSDALSLKTFFTSFLLKNTLEGYFGDPMYGGNKDMAAWKMIGHPGVRADYLEFVAEAKPYPYGPVSLHGKRG